MPTGEISQSAIVEAFVARLRALNVPRCFAIAVSGGRDSMALARLVADYGRDNGAQIIAYSVDHGLRPEAAAEVEQAGKWCNAIGLAHRILTWEGEKPNAGIQAAARKARYRLLAHAAAEDGCMAVLTAHSADDQAETVFMRLARGAGPHGLGAMGDEIMIAAGPGAPVRLLRPLLFLTRAQLTAIVDHAGQGFVDDPSNDDPQFERVKTRALLAALEEQNLLTGVAVNRTASKLAAAATRLRRQEDDLFTALGGCFYAWGGASLSRLEANAALGGLVARLIHAVSGEDYAPDEAAAQTAINGAAKDGAATLGGALIKTWKGSIWFLREPGAVLGRSEVPPMAPKDFKGALLWDGRFILEGQEGVRSVSVRPIGKDKSALGPGIEGFSGPGEAIPTSPGIYQRNALTGAPALPFMASGGIHAQALVKERFSGGIIRY